MHLLPQNGRSDQRSLDAPASTDRLALTRALDLAAAASAFASPNPTVGCVLRIQEKILGEGAHRYGNRDHAEIVALKAAFASGNDPRGATSFVTLEPCSHHGRTGPCADALVAAGIARCVVATVDPNPLVSGQGIARLRAAGVAVSVLDPADPLAQRARRLNDAFAFSIQHDRPFVTLKAAVSQDGKLAPDPATRHLRQPVWLTGTAARDDVQQLRHASDAILTGIGTVLADDPSLTDRTGLPRRKPLVRVVLDSHLRLPLSAKVVTSAQEDVMVFCTEAAPEAREAALRSHGVEIVRLTEISGRLDLHAVLSALTSFRSVLLEAGSALNAAFLAANLVDRLVLYTAPDALGPTALPFAHGFELPGLLNRLTDRVEQAFPSGTGQQDIRLTGYLHDPWRTAPTEPG